LGLLTLAVACLPLALRAAAASEIPDFNRQIRPILSDKCFRCHGPDENERKGGDDGLRLDTLEGAKVDLGGYQAIFPGAPEKSEVLSRILSEDPKERMPPRKTGKTLTSEEIDLLKRWIAGGAPYARHWSYEPPARAPLPGVKNSTWGKGPLDRFILARLAKEGLRPQPEADRAALARRVALDLTGLPPTAEEVEVFSADSAATAYESFVDRQLAKPAYGEHWARGWLDLARYADSKGYADDQPRSIWRYRDYVINAFNRNLPFDQFTIEQLAGDLLPNPTTEQLFATGFHRNTMNNTEGGTDDEEFRSVAIVDRVNTTMAVWMGTSMACAQCHTHKYDPLTQKEYFQLYAIFNQSEDADKNDESPVLEFYTDAQQTQRATWEKEMAALNRQLIAARPAHAAAAAQWAREFPVQLDWQFPKPTAAKSAGKAVITLSDDGNILVAPGQTKDTYTIELPLTGSAPVTALRVEARPHDSLPSSGPGGAEGNFVVTRVRAGIQSAEPIRRARFVRVELPGKDRALQLAEVQIFSGGENVAGRGAPSQSSTASGAWARRAIDGLTDGNVANNSVTQTTVSENPWWEIDLNSTFPLERVVVWGRTGAEATPAGLRVVLLDEERQPVWELVARDAPMPSKLFDFRDPVEIKLQRVVADYAQADLDESFIITDLEPKTPNFRKRTALKKGWGVAGATGRAHAVSFQPEKPITLQPAEKLVVTIEQRSATDHATLNHFRVGFTTDARSDAHLRVPPAALAALQVTPSARDASQTALILDYYIREIAPELKRERQSLAALQRSLSEMPLNSSPIMRELAADQQRKTHVQLRGNFRALDEEVSPGVPAVFPPLPAGAPVNRLTLARWLVDESNPMTARVLANRYWEAIFGIGLVRTSEDFGSQGELPTHPELLDWLARDLVEGKWDLKRFLKTLVTSAAYRQSSQVTPEALAADPENRLLARGPRFRLAAELVRDQALAVSGLLSSKMHGPSGRPFQPAFDLRAAFGSALDWKTSAGEDRYRRGLYTEWRRSSPYPSMVTFDAPNREVCTVRRNRSNTPLQALVTLNDPVYVEATQGLARLMAGVRGAAAEKARHGFRRVLARPPAGAELKELLTLFDQAAAAYRSTPDDALALIGGTENPLPAEIEPVELAAWTAVANVLLNLDETVMKR
jgi:hypothetical protein